MDAQEVNRSYYNVREVMGMLGVKEDKAYKIMKSLKLELVKQGKLTPDYPAGKVPKQYFNERCAIS